jgi:hypothetical protein
MPSRRRLPAFFAEALRLLSPFPAYPTGGKGQGGLLLQKGPSAKNAEMAAQPGGKGRRAASEAKRLRIFLCQFNLKIVFSQLLVGGCLPYGHIFFYFFFLFFLQQALRS